MISEGAFIRANFPFGHPPEVRSRPGPSPHIAYYLGRRGGELRLAYTRSGPWRGVSARVPIGVVEFNAADAAKLNQRPFHIDLRCLARVLPVAAWLPRWDEPGHGVVAVADPVTKDRILREAERLARSSPEIIEIRGITGQTVVTRRPTP